MRFVDLFAGLGGFRVALERLGHECVFACEVDPQLQELYCRNFPDGPAIHSNIRTSKQHVPPHDVLCAGFPCQPFSKSGAQAGLSDETSGTLFHEILDILRQHRPSYVILENVGNFERHDEGRTWRIVRSSLRRLGYEVRATDHLASGGEGLLSPHHLGFPHHRERFFAVASRFGVPKNVFPSRNRKVATSMEDVVQPRDELSERDLEETRIVDQHSRCIEHWNTFLGALPEERVVLPSFPIWGDEIDATYPYEDMTPWAYMLGAGNGVASKNGTEVTLDSFQALPSYAKRQVGRFPEWKVRFINANRTWLSSIRSELPQTGSQSSGRFLPLFESWSGIAKARPGICGSTSFSSGHQVSASRGIETVPSLVAMTSTQIPILGPKRRHLSRVEGLRLQGFPDDFHVPDSRTATFRALGNAVHVGVVYEIAARLLCGGDSDIGDSRWTS